MKVRNGFVSNSSSSCFILDKREPKVQEWLSKVEKADYFGEWPNEETKGIGEKLDTPENLNRCTALAVGQNAINYANDYNSYDWGDYPGSLGNWILEWALTLGKDNVVFVRESDEGMGSYLSEWPDKDLILSEMEYH